MNPGITEVTESGLHGRPAENGMHFFRTSDVLRRYLESLRMLRAILLPHEECGAKLSFSKVIPPSTARVTYYLQSHDPSATQRQSMASLRRKGSDP